MCKLLEKVIEVKMIQLSIRMEVIYMVIIFIQMTDGIYLDYANADQGPSESFA